ncbi:LCP family protein [Streptomyces sp. CG1]|uniref:LCP family protein n=1 Tax=Streptomyces sp. CG1 TaxID=1287523 RepID=UPI0034E21F21
MGLSLLVLATAGVGRICLALAGGIGTFDAGGVSSNRPGGAGNGENVLVIGSDARVGGNNALGGGNKDDVGRSDTAFLLHLYGDHRHAVVVSIPRDTLVTIPPCRLPDGSWSAPRPDTVFNAAYSVGQTPKGDPVCTQNTVEKLTGLRVDHTVVVDFKAFAKLTEAVGGVSVCVPQDVYQKDLNPNRATRGALLFHKGVQTLAGGPALDYVRIRHGIGDGSDIGRIKRQQAFVASLIKKVRSDGITPANLLPLAEAAVQSLTVDPGLGTADKLVSFAMTLKDIDLHNTKFVTLPWRYQGSRVAVVRPDADRLWAALRADRPVDGRKTGPATRTPPAATTTTPASSAGGPSVFGHGIAVRVHNGTPVAGLASQAARTLSGHGFTVTGIGNEGEDYPVTLVRYGPGHRTEAETVAPLFPGAQLQPTADPGITVILGRTNTTPVTQPPTSGPAPSADSTRSDDDPCSDLSYGQPRAGSVR